MRRAILAGGLAVPLILMACVATAEELQTQSPYGQTPYSQTPYGQTPYSQTPQGPGVAPTAGPAPVGAYPNVPLTMSQGAVGVVPALQVRGVQVPGAALTNFGGEVSTVGSYTLGPDDVVYIAVRNQPEFTGPFVVGQNGMIQYGIIGDIKTDGLTKEELADVLTERLKQYVRFPAVHVIITGFNSKAIYILGQVRTPGKYAMRGDTITLRDAIVAAGLESEHSALSRVKIIKTDDRSPTSQKVNLKKVLYKGKTAENIELVNGDVVVIPKTIWGHVTGFIGSVLGPVFRVAKWAVI